MIRGQIHDGSVNVLGNGGDISQGVLLNGCTIGAATASPSLNHGASTAAMVLTGVAGAVLVNVPPVRSTMPSTALGRNAVGVAVPLLIDVALRLPVTYVYDDPKR